MGKRHRVRMRGSIVVAVAVAVAWSALAPLHAQGWRHVGNVDAVQVRDDGVELASGAARVRVTAFADGVLRVRLAPDGAFTPDASWAVVASPAKLPVRVVDDAARVTVTAGDVVATVHKAPLRVEFADAGGRVLLADAADQPMAWMPAADGRTRVRTWKQLPADEHFYGLGDKAGPLDRRGRAFTHWNTDAYAWAGWTDPLYKSIPFYLGLRGGVAYGVFLDNTWRSSFDFGLESPERAAFGADGGELDYYFIAGPAPARVVERYTALTGRTPLPPLWALGFQQSRYTYLPEARVREVAATLRARRIPSDAIYLDIGYQQGNAPFTVDRTLFPAFEQMIADLRAQGLRTVLITDLHIPTGRGKDYAPYATGTAQDVFIKLPDGKPYVGEVWPGPSVFPDFSLTRVRDWWGGLYRDFAAMGAAGYWNDMNEPSVFRAPGNTMALDAVHRLDDGRTASHRELHNAYGMLNARATYDGLRKLKPGERPFVLTRAAYAGTQRYAATWTGDNTASWHHLAQGTPNVLSMGLSGYTLVGDDVGGFIGSPSPELLTRWFELGAFNPVFRNHAATDTRDHEAWVDGDAHEARRRAAVERRYRLMPYLYTLAEQNARTGAPILRPVFYEYPAAESFYANGRDFLFGADLFVAPVVDDAMDAHVVNLPPGEWYAFGSATRQAAGKEPIKLDPRPAGAPLYARAGALIPMQPLVQHTGQTPDGPLQLHAYLPSPGSASTCAGALYQDDGAGYAHEAGAFLRMAFACAAAKAKTTITARVEHDGFAPWWQSIDVVVHGAPRRPRGVRIDGRAVDGWSFDPATGALTVSVPAAKRDWRVEVGY